MTATDNGKITLPPKPLGDGPGPGDAPVSEPHRAGASRTRTRERWKARLARVQIGAALSGASVIDGKPDSWAGVWAAHAASARHSSWPLVKWLRLAWGAWHAGVEVPLARGFEWSGQSFSRRAGCVLILAAIAWLLGLF